MNCDGILKKPPIQSTNTFHPFYAVYSGGGSSERADPICSSDSCIRAVNISFLSLKRNAVVVVVDVFRNEMASGDLPLKNAPKFDGAIDVSNERDVSGNIGCSTETYEQVTGELTTTTVKVYSWRRVKLSTSILRTQKFKHERDNSRAKIIYLGSWMGAVRYYHGFGMAVDTVMVIGWTCYHLDEGGTSTVLDAKRVEGQSSLYTALSDLFNFSPSSPFQLFATSTPDMVSYNTPQIVKEAPLHTEDSYFGHGGVYILKDLKI
ncbi:hypothetical protein B0H14DRAFT_2642263 [Mycena olivaceomarginata]|nr:hypothetical protein B0H14DRAFT_2642263 [Mycena olivaceomarginata]